MRKPPTSGPSPDHPRERSRSSLLAELRALRARVGALEDDRAMAAQFSAIAELSPDAILLNAQDRLAYANRAAVELLRARDSEDLVGRALVEIVPPEFHGLVRRRIRAVLESGEPAPLAQYRWRCLDGTEVEVEVSAGFIEWEEAPAVLVTARDITRRRKAESALHVSEERFRTIADLVPDLLWSNDADGNVTWYNRRWFEYTGQATGQALGLRWLDALHPDDRETSLESFRAAAAEGRALQHEHRIRGALGAYRWFLIRTSPVVDERGGISQWLGSATDIHDQRTAFEAERGLKERTLWELAELESIYRTAPIGLAVLDRDLRFVRANTVLAVMNHLPVEEHLGRTVREVVPALADVAEPILRRVLATGEAVSNVELADPAPDPAGRVRRWSAQYAPLLAEGGRVLGVNAVLEEVTERKEAEEELRLAKATADRASALKSRFLAAVSHDFRTPLSAVLGFADLLEAGIHGPVNPRQVQALSQIRQAALELLGIVDEVLEFTRSERGEEEVRLRETDVAELVRGVARLIRDAAERKGLELVVTGADAPVIALTDRGKARRIVTNLLENAVKYTDGARVEVELVPSIAGVEVRVRDDGPGIPSERLEEIFEPFVRLEQTGSHEKTGTGLGLAIARRFARRLGGDLTVVSGPGAGSTFVLRLPLGHAWAPGLLRR